MPGEPVKEHYDVVIVGAGISGICAAYYLQRDCPNLTYAIVERRAQLGGTWDLFRYPGIRSDSDMWTFSFPFRRWTQERTYGSGDDILAYIDETTREFGIDKHFKFRTSVVEARWTDEARQWALTVATTHSEHDGTRQGHRPDPSAPQVVAGTERQVTARFLVTATGYYSYDSPCWPEFPGQADFKGEIVHPQFWDPKRDFAGKRVVIIGSGATAMTLAPSMAERGAGRVTVLQRSPTYVAALPQRAPAQKIIARFAWFLPASWQTCLLRWWLIFMAQLTYQMARRRPESVKKLLKDGVIHYLGRKLYEEQAVHFTPKYNPWDQRICVVPDGDLLRGIKAGRIEMVTDHIATFTRGGIRLESGKELEADMIIPATGLTMQFRGGMRVVVNGKELAPHEFTSYRGAMFGDVPNMFALFGYLNASWALKAGLISEYMSRVISHMEANGKSVVVPRPPKDLEVATLSEFTSGYLMRGAAQLPRQGKQSPWRVHQNYFLDILGMRWSSLRDPHLQYA